MGEPYQLDAFPEEVPERAPLQGREGFSDITTREAPPPPIPANDGGIWSWFNDEDEKDIVVGEQRAIAVYRNGSQNIVIREQSPDGEREDHFVVLRDEIAAKALIARLQQEVGAKR